MISCYPCASNITGGRGKKRGGDMMNKSTRNLTLIFIQIFSAYEVQKMGPFL
jgi:hypothetical protein